MRLDLPSLKNYYKDGLKSQPILPEHPDCVEKVSCKPNCWHQSPGKDWVLPTAQASVGQSPNTLGPQNLTPAKLTSSHLSVDSMDEYMDE